MTKLADDPSLATATRGSSPEGAPPDSVRDALIESRRRWQHLVSLAADLAFETDADGRFVLVTPDNALGWLAGSLIGQSSDVLVGDDGSDSPFNPFRPTVEVRRRRAWLRCADGRLATMNISASPLRDATGSVVGARGIAVDITDADEQSSLISGRLRRVRLLDHILSRAGQEADPDGMMDAALWALIRAFGAEGAAVIGKLSEATDIEVLHECGSDASAVLEAAACLMTSKPDEPDHLVNGDGRLVLAVGCRTRAGVEAGLVIWRAAASRPWDEEDKALAGLAVGVVRMVLEHEAMQREMARQARTDPLTGLLNRRAFIEEMRREIARLDRSSQVGTLLFIDMDSFKPVNDRLGHATGDKILVHLADMLRKLVRPGDVITRMGGDEFAVWLSGADHMTAAERADFLCKAAPDELQALLPEAFPKLGVSVGIATRGSDSRESIEDLTRRADMAMYAVKRSGRRHWRVSLPGAVDGHR